MTEIIDLTRKLDESLSIYSGGGYSDPPLLVESWCAIEEQGFKVSRLSMGTQTGTHIDAPAHFSPLGETLDSLPLDALVRPYLWVDLDRTASTDLCTFKAGVDEERILFLSSTAGSCVEISLEVFDALLELPCRVWVISTEVRVVGQEAFHFHRVLSEAGVYLIEDIDESAARRVKPGGELFALPLRLSGVTGSPCRVVVRQE